MGIEKSRHSRRLARLRRRLVKEKLDALLVLYLPNVRYLTGFTGSSGAVLVDRRSATFITDFRYRLQALKEVKSCRRYEQTGGLAAAVAEIMSRKKAESLGFEGRHTTWAFHRDLSRGIGKEKLRPAEGLVEELRAIKDSGEVALIRKAIAAAGEAYRQSTRRMTGRREEDVAVAMERRMVDAGADGPAFPTIVAAGPRGALPHAVPGRAAVKKNELVVVDFGARRRGYHSDTTRTLNPGRPREKAREIYRVVTAAQAAAVEAIRPGVLARDVDAAARDVITAAGYGKCFGHGTGHGVGLEVHEYPSISPRSGEVIAPGMVFTVEPGIYLENFGGVRIEDMVLVTHGGCEILTRSIPRRDL